nr:hypothetical protein [Actinoplanes utahensis]
MGLFLIVLMCVATVALIRNMNKRIRRLPDSFPASGKQDRAAEIAGSGDSAPGSGAAVPADVEAGRSGPSAAAEEPEVAGVRDEQSGSAANGGAERS